MKKRKKEKTPIDIKEFEMSYNAGKGLGTLIVLLVVGIGAGLFVLSMWEPTADQETMTVELSFDQLVESAKTPDQGGQTSGQ